MSGRFISIHRHSSIPSHLSRLLQPGGDVVQRILYRPWVNVLFTGLTAMLLFLLGRNVAGTVAGIAAALIFAADPSGNSHRQPQSDRNVGYLLDRAGLLLAGVFRFSQAALNLARDRGGPRLLVSPRCRKTRLCC